MVLEYLYLQNWVISGVNVGIHIPAPWSTGYDLGIHHLFVAHFRDISYAGCRSAWMPWRESPLDEAGGHDFSEMLIFTIFLGFNGI